MRKRFDDILSECIRRLEVSGGDLEAVLSRYPEQADELRPYLEVWISLAAVEKAQASARGVARARQELLTGLARTERPARGVGFTNGLASKGGLSMKFVAIFAAGVALTLGAIFLTGNLGTGGGSTATADVPLACLLSLDFNDDGNLTVEDVLAFKNGIDTQDPAFDVDNDGDVDIHDVVGAVGQLVDCFQNQQPPTPAGP